MNAATFNDSDKTFACDKCGKRSPGVPPNSALASQMDFEAAVSFVKSVGWIFFADCQHNLICACDVCKGEWDIDPIQLHEIATV